MNQEVLDKLHKCMVEIYLEIARICDKHRLLYFAVGGTLLGAVVHAGFIPWDDDLDIAMPRDDYDKFIAICRDELDSRFYLHHTSTDEDYWLPFIKVRRNNTVFLEEKRKKVKSHAGVYVDIFPFDYSLKKNTLSHKFKWRLITYLNNHINKKVTGNIVKSKSGILLSKLFDCFSVKTLSKFRDKIMRSFDCSKRKLFVDLAGGRRLDNSYFNIEDIFPITELSFGSIKIKTPSNAEKYLLQLYGERYVVIPPVEEQVTHDSIEIVFSDE